MENWIKEPNKLEKFRSLQINFEQFLKIYDNSEHKNYFYYKNIFLSHLNKLNDLTPE